MKQRRYRHSFSNLIATSTLWIKINVKIIKRSRWYKNLAYLFIIYIIVSFIWVKINGTRESKYFDEGLRDDSLRQYADAVDNFTKAIAIKPNYGYPYSYRGLAKYYLTDYSGALEDCNKAIELDGKYEPAYNNRALAENHLNNYQSAIKDCEKAIELKPTDTHAAYVYANLGFAKTELKDYKGAIEAYNKSLFFKPDNPTVYCNRGLTKIYSGDSTSGCIDLKKASEFGDQEAKNYIQKYCK